jgi:hypothetical protein
MPGMPGTGHGAGGTAGVRTDPTRSLYVVVPYTNDISKREHFYKKAPMGSFNPSWQPAVKHQFGYANLLMDNTSTQLYLDMGPQATKGNKTRFTELNSKHLRLPAVPDGQAMLDLVNEALENGFVPEAMKYSDELLAAVNDKKAKTSPQVDRFLAAYAKIREDIVRPAKSASDGGVWKDRIGFGYGGVKEFVSPHYHVLFWDGMDAELNRRVAQLEDNFKAFFLVNALRGVAIPVPEKPLIVVLAKSTTDVRNLSASLDGMPAISDGFYSPDHGILVLSPERLDAVSQTFNRQIQDMFRQGISRAQLLAGEGPKIDDKGYVKDSKTSTEVARMQTWVIAERYAEEEAEWAAVSREGTRQLLHATGLLPQHVSLPLWLAEGSANYYHRPKGPAFSQDGDKDVITVALSTGYGVPNYVRQKQFSELLRLGQFSVNSKDKPNAGQMLRNVVTDAYFNAAVSGLDIDNPKLPLPPAPPKPAAGAPATMPAPEDPVVVKRRRAEFLVMKSQATAWSLYYFLAKVHGPGLERYVAELNKMPRDLPLGEFTRIEAFARAFNLSLDGKKADGKSTFEELGAAWLQYMATVPAAGADVHLTDLSAGAGGAAGTGPGGAFPGGAPPMPNPGPMGPR